MKKDQKVKKTYVAPALKKWGTIVDLTKTGGTQGTLPLGDAKNGSISWSNGQ